MKVTKKNNNKDDILVIRIEKEIKKQFTKINKENNIKNSQKLRGWIKAYINKENPIT
ncbi:hypothetical protein P9386_10240 [Caldifermentibacillus hisashii]|uniref:hypothetical protein n=1 Tax=Caldifermentibacillus hisashii TaxID=996558 RepID=UPI0022B9B265|nr:hypothetical protein [Caldifermentibacillus hisashii]MED4852195.1 hypothetical protein [Caldifermentibacillus hisashii]